MGVSFLVSFGDAGPAGRLSLQLSFCDLGGRYVPGLQLDGSLKSETGWSKAGGGCSVDEVVWLRSPHSRVRAGEVRQQARHAGVSLDADPNSGAAVYDSSSYYGQVGWYQAGGTSLSSPMWAGRAAVSGAVFNAAYVYGTSMTFRVSPPVTMAPPAWLVLTWCSVGAVGLAQRVSLGQEESPSSGR